jgi:cystathionine beta-lyase
MSHASIPAEVRAARGLPDDLVRISAGIEHIDDLIADLDQAMVKAMSKVGMKPDMSKGGHAHASEPSQEHLLLRIKQLEEQLRELTTSRGYGSS